MTSPKQKIIRFFRDRNISAFWLTSALMLTNAIFVWLIRDIHQIQFTQPKTAQQSLHKPSSVSEDETPGRNYATGAKISTGAESFQDLLLIQNQESNFNISLFVICGFSFVAWIIALQALIVSQRKLASGLAEKESAVDSLQRSENRFRQFFDNANDIIFTLDLSENFTSFNKMGEIVSGYKIAELTQMKISQIIAPESLEVVRQMLSDKLLNSRGSTRYETEIITKAGKRIFLEVNSQLLINEGQPTGIQGIARDITERWQAAEDKKKSEQYQNLFKSANDAILIFEAENEIILEVNDRACEIYGWERDEFVGRSLKNMSQDVSRGSEELEKLLRDGIYEEFESVHFRSDGLPLNVIINAAVIEYQGQPAILTINRDVTFRKQADAALRESENKLRTLFDSMSEGLLQVNNEGIIEFVNDRLCEMTGYAAEELLGQSPRVLFDTAEKERITVSENLRRLEGASGQHEMCLKKKTGEDLWVIVGSAPIINAAEAIVGSMDVFTDITERKRAEEKLLHDAFHDALTGLANRALFMDHLRLAIERGRRNKKASFAILFLDCDHFKNINDSLGHYAGDKFLQSVARRLETTLRAGDLIARLGGDEFTILLSEISGEDEAVRIAERLQAELKKSFRLDQQDIFVSASIGITLNDPEYMTAEEMLRDADIAMYCAKAAGKAQHQMFNKEMRTRAATRLKLETEMRAALENQEFRVYYQPIVNLQTGNLNGFEALIRWQHPKRGMISPAEFISAAEENGLIVPLGSWILLESCRQLRRWQDEHPKSSPLSISVNLSSKQFLQSDLIKEVAVALATTKLDPRCLKLEITESHLMENSDSAVRTLDGLRSLGVELSVDDFGTGYSSLSYLHQLPIDYLKIDRSFISRMIESRENSEIVHTIIKLARSLRLKVIAEGIESEDQVQYLKKLNCEFGQGYFFSKPLDGETAKSFLCENIDRSTIFSTDRPLDNNSGRRDKMFTKSF